jgi:ubiquinone/menaquinone biosynthesis C-methylase UbiE
MTPVEMRAAWNRVSANYQSNHAIPTHSAHYGPWAPLENDLRLLGDVAGKRILDLGCGGGQCCIAFAKQGAIAVGLDLSDGQLQVARSLAHQEHLNVTFVQGTMDDLSHFSSADWDIVFSTYAFQYLADVPACLAECQRVLRPGGMLVFSLDHPFRDCFFDQEDEEVTVYASRNYFDHTPMRWLFGENNVIMTSYHHTIAEWLEMLGQAGFALRRLARTACTRGDAEHNLAAR